MIFMINCTAPYVGIREIRVLNAQKLWITISIVRNIGITSSIPKPTLH